jgi:ubiquinone/menaquinone biosynthesis C-methylase UbiE
MGLYSNWIFPLLCDLTLDQPFVAKHRHELLAGVGGDILEIGFGTGLNLPHYPEHVRQIKAIDPNPGMGRRARRRIEHSGIEVDKRLLGGEQLPFEAETFDFAVSTFTLCSVAHVGQALAEIHRVLKPAGSFLFLEHGLCPEPAVRKWQQRLNWVQRWVAGNCHLDRNIRALVAEQPFRSVETDEFYLERTPKTHGYIYRGRAMK